MSDNDLKKDFNEAYDSAQSYWSPYLTEANKDMAFLVGDQWDINAKKYLERQRRSALSFNKIHRVVQLVSGYQRKNRLSLRVDPVEGSDEATADILSGVVQWQMQASNIYETMSDAFHLGPLASGMGFVHCYMDYCDDPLNGQIRVKRIPHNKCLMDPATSERDLSDCGFFLRREYMPKDAVKALLPSARKDIENIKVGTTDTRYSDATQSYWAGRKDLLRFDEYWRRTYNYVTILVDKTTGQMWDYSNIDPERAEMALMVGHGRLEKMQMYRKGVERIVLVEDNVMLQEPDTSGLDDYPFVPLLGFWIPEMDQANWKLQGLVRLMRDPQTEVNKRRSKMLDMIDSQISSGWKAKENSVANPESLYQSGQGQVVWMKGEMEDAQKLMAADLPPGLLQLSEILDRDIMEIPGANSELMGMAESNDIQVAGILAKMRQGQGVTILQPIFDNYRLAKKQLGHKIIKLIQSNYTAQKVQRITGKQPTPEFYRQDFAKYDCIPVEGVISDSQRQTSLAQLMGMKQMGAPIPWTAVIDVASIEDKENLKKHLQQAEQAQAGQAQQAQQMQQLQIAATMAKIKEMLAEQQREATHAVENIEDAKYKRAKTMAEIEAMGFDRYLELMRLYAQMEQIQQQGQLQPTQQQQQPGMQGAMI